MPEKAPHVAKLRLAVVDEENRLLHTWDDGRIGTAILASVIADEIPVVEDKPPRLRVKRAAYNPTKQRDALARAVKRALDGLLREQH